jgi:CHAT domain-containing protein
MVLADPVFDRQDERLGGSRASGERRDPDPALARTLRDVGVGGLPRLPFTRREARRILSLVPGASSRAALDFDANLATATDPALAGYRYLHFATHGFLNGARPELSGLVLSLVDRSGRDVRGFLSAREVFSLRLSAELVVLSGCSTGLGKEMKGEGIVGLTRAFMHAGSERVIASLWEVDDAATEELMGRLYEAMLGAGKKRPAAALREAQLALISDPRWRAPFYWAGFQVHGEWN